MMKMPRLKNIHNLQAQNTIRRKDEVIHLLHVHYQPQKIPVIHAITGEVGQGNITKVRTVKVREGRENIKARKSTSIRKESIYKWN